MAQMDPGFRQGDGFLLSSMTTTTYVWDSLRRYATHLDVGFSTGRLQWDKIAWLARRGGWTSAADRTCHSSKEIRQVSDARKAKFTLAS